MKTYYWLYSLCCKEHYVTLLLVACFWIFSLFPSVCWLFVDCAAVALCASVWWGLLPRPQALQGGRRLRGVGVRQLRGHPPRARPGLGVVHQCGAHAAGPECPVEGGQPHRLDRGAHLLRGLLHSPETVWGETKPRPLQCVDSSTWNLSFCFVCVPHFYPKLMKNTQPTWKVFFFVPAGGSWNLVFLPKAANRGLTLMWIWIFWF